MSSPIGAPDTPVAGPYAVKLPIFEGPLDLLLHLIRMNEVDVTEIPIATIAEQYVETLGLMHELNLDVAGEYLVMAATLAWIKSRMILPPSGEDGDDEEVDPRAELIARLLEYQRFKDASEELAERQRLERDVFQAHGVGPDPTPDSEREVAVSLVNLLEAFRRVVRTAKPSGPGVHEVEAEHITVHERMIVVMHQLDGHGAVEFARVFELEGGGLPSRAVLVTTFLAILELARLSAVRLYQGVDDFGVPSGSIHLRAADSGGVPWQDRIADVM